MSTGPTVGDEAGPALRGRPTAGGRAGPVPGSEAGLVETGTPQTGVRVLPRGAGLRGPGQQSRVAFSGLLPQVISQVRPDGSCTPGTSLTGPRGQRQSPRRQPWALGGQPGGTVSTHAPGLPELWPSALQETALIPLSVNT